MNPWHSDNKAYVLPLCRNCCPAQSNLLTVDVDLNGGRQRLVDGLVLGSAAELGPEVAAAEADSNLVPAGSGSVGFLERAGLA